jgi:hypothetical protein
VACGAQLDMHCRWTAEVPQVPNGAGNSVWLRPQRCRDLLSPDLGPPRFQRSGGTAKFLSGTNRSQRVVSAMLLCLCAEPAPARAAGTVSGQQANAAQRTCAWCSLEAAFELLAAKKLLYEAGLGQLPALAAKLWVGNRSRLPSSPTFIAQPRHFWLFRPLFKGAFALQNTLTKPVKRRK